MLVPRPGTVPTVALATIGAAATATAARTLLVALAPAGCGTGAARGTAGAALRRAAGLATTLAPVTATLPATLAARTAAGTARTALGTSAAPGAAALATAAAAWRTAAIIAAAESAGTSARTIVPLLSGRPIRETGGKGVVVHAASASLGRRLPRGGLGQVVPRSGAARRAVLPAAPAIAVPAASAESTARAARSATRPAASAALAAGLEAASSAGGAAAIPAITASIRSGAALGPAIPVDIAAGAGLALRPVLAAAASATRSGPGPCADDAPARADPVVLDHLVAQLGATHAERSRRLLQGLDEVAPGELSGRCLGHRFLPFLRSPWEPAAPEGTADFSGGSLRAFPGRALAELAAVSVGGSARLKSCCCPI